MHGIRPLAGRVAAAELQARHGSPVHAVAADVSDARAMEAFARSTREALGPAHAVICNAGVLGPVGPIFRVDPTQWSDDETFRQAGSHRFHDFPRVA